MKGLSAAQEQGQHDCICAPARSSCVRVCSVRTGCRSCATGPLASCAMDARARVWARVSCCMEAFIGLRTRYGHHATVGGAWVSVDGRRP